MSEKCPVIAVTGLQKYKDDMEMIQEKLTKQYVHCYSNWFLR
ncbi:hypothetical protein [Blautia sp. 1033sp1_1033st1_G9_1033SCRN_220408]